MTPIDLDATKLLGFRLSGVTATAHGAKIGTKTGAKPVLPPAPGAPHRA